MTEFAIRPATPADAERMAEVIANGREQTYGLRPGSYEYLDMVTGWRGQRGAMTVQNYMAATGSWSFIGRPPRSLVAVRTTDNAVVGVMTSRDLNERGQQSVNLDFLFVDPQEQGKGLGHLLMDNLTEYAGNRQQSLSVVAHNGRARRLYEKYGFQVVMGAVTGYPPLQFQEMVKPAAY